MAKKLSLILTANQIENQVDREDSGDFSIWVLDDEHVAQGSSLLKDFSENPDASQFSGQAESGKKILSQENRRSKKRAANIVTMERLQYEKAWRGIPILTVFMIAVSGIVALLSHFGANKHLLSGLFIQSIDLNNPLTMNTLDDVMRGQVWRLVTPIFIHFGILHFAFNCYWIYFLGGEIERRRSSWYFASLVLAIAICSNLAQFWWSASPFFGGLSGVAYGLFGFLWMKSKFASNEEWFLPPATVQVMLIWLVLCMTGMIGHVANAAHVAGLLVGVAWGFISARVRR